MQPDLAGACRGPPASACPRCPPRARRRTPASRSGCPCAGSRRARPAARRRDRRDVAGEDPRRRRCPSACSRSSDAAAAWRYSSTSSPTCLPSAAQAQPRCVSRIWPTFMRDGTPSGLSTMSTGVPSSRNGMSSIGTIARDHALVAVPAGHLVAGLQLALHRDEDLDHLHHAGRQLVAALQLLDLALEALLQALDGSVELALQRLDLRHARHRRRRRSAARSRGRTGRARSSSITVPALTPLARRRRLVRAAARFRRP